jgi:hypothetical protein
MCALLETCRTVGIPRDGTGLGEAGNPMHIVKTTKKVSDVAVSGKDSGETNIALLYEDRSFDTRADPSSREADARWSCRSLTILPVVRWRFCTNKGFKIKFRKRKCRRLIDCKWIFRTSHL